MCLGDSRADTQHYKNRQWPARQRLEPGSRNVLLRPLVDLSKELLPPLHIKLGFMKNFVIKGIRQRRQWFSFSLWKIKKKCEKHFFLYIFDGPEIRELMKDASVDESLNPIKLSGWLALKPVIVNFLGNPRSFE